MLVKYLTSTIYSMRSLSHLQVSSKQDSIIKIIDTIDAKGIRKVLSGMLKWEHVEKRDFLRCPAKR